MSSFHLGFPSLPQPSQYRLPISAGIVAALTWPASLLTVANVIDNPWGVCLHRSAEVGKHLAHILLSRQQVQGMGLGVCVEVQRGNAQSPGLLPRKKQRDGGLTRV